MVKTRLSWIDWIPRGSAFLKRTVKAEPAPVEEFAR